MSRPLTRLTTALVAVAALTAAFAVPAYAEDEPPDGELTLPECPAFPGAPSAEDEFEAYRLALACGVNVEVLSLRDIDRQVFATPVGTLDAQMAVQPYQVRNAEGVWGPIDPTLVVRPDGTAAAAATVIGVTTSAGGDAPFVIATDPGGGALSLRWPKGPLPAPVVSGAVATFPNVLPDIDLAVQAEGVGFSWVLVVKTPEAAANPELETIEVGIETVGLTVVEDAESSRIDVLDADGNVVFEAGQGIMWDSSTAGETPSGFSAASAEEPAADPGRIADVAVQSTATGITLVPDTAMLADPAVTFPLYIDPPFTSTRKAWANVLQSRSGTGWTGDSSWPRSGGMRVGLDTWPTCGDGCGLWRSVITLNIGGLKGKYIASASVNMLQTHMGGCDDRYLQLWRTGAVSNGVSWNGVDWYYGEQLQSKLVPSSNKTGCSGKDNEWVEFDGGEVKKRVQSAADQKHSTISFGIRSSNEDTRDAWRRIKTDSVKLHVTYYIYPPTPDRMTVDGAGCDPTESGSPWVSERYPTFSARARSAEDEPVYLRFRVRKVALETNHYYYRTPDAVGPYSTVTRKTTTSLPDGSYKWQARTDSRQTEAVNSGYTGYCYFKVDATKPTVPSVLGPPGAITAGSNVALTVSASDPTVNGVKSGIDRFEYSWTTDTYDQKVSSTGTATITRPAVAAGRHVLYVRAVDKAGNESERKVYTFFAGRDIPATPMGAWRLGGDLVDDTGHGNNLSVLSGSAVFSTDTARNTVLRDTSDCLTAPAPLRTDAAFTVATRVRLMSESDAGTPVIMSQGLPGSRMFDLTIADRRVLDDKQISFRVWSSAGTSATMYTVRGTVPADSSWVHVAADYDPDAGRIRLYLNGAIVAEAAAAFTPWNAKEVFTVGCRDWNDGTTTGFFNGDLENLGVWQGLLSSAQITAKAQLPSGEIAHWDLRGDGKDASAFARDLTLPESAKQGFDPFGRPDGALVLDGQSCAKTTGAILPADAAFAMSAWVKPTTVGGGRFQVILAQADAAGNGVVLGIDELGRWAYGSASAEGPTAASIQPLAVVSHPPVAGRWQHVALRYNGSGYVSLHVNGEVEYNSARTVNHAAVPFTVGCMNGANHFQGMFHDIRVWRGDPGLATMPGVGFVPAEVNSWWDLDGSGADASGKGRDFTFTGGYEPADGWNNFPDNAVKFSGDGSAATSGPVVATDESFTVGAWVRLDSLATNQVFLSAAGTQNTGFRLAYNTTRLQFEFTMTSQDAPSGSGGVFSVAYGGPSPTVGAWYFVVGTFDLKTKMMRLYVNGAEVGTRTGPAAPWKAAGPLVLGAAATTTSRWNHLTGRVDDVVVWQGTVSARAIANMYGTNASAVS